MLDDHIRLDIRNSRFVVADLTHGNQGVYWEAGFAEALGRPVFLLSRDGERVHFDLNHQRIIFWKDGDGGLALAANELKLAIRVKLPYEARMQDPKEASQ